jgi:hypothetical protein
MLELLFTCLQLCISKQRNQECEICESAFVLRKNARNVFSFGESYIILLFPKIKRSFRSVCVCVQKKRRLEIYLRRKMKVNRDEEDDNYKTGTEFKNGRYTIVRFLHSSRFGRVDLVFDLEKNSKYIS